MVWNDIRIKRFIKALADIMRENKEYLIELDSVVGDGDLGLTMSDGFKAASMAIADNDEKDCGKLLYAAGKAMSTAVPSTMGTLMAAGLMAAGKAIKGNTELDATGNYIILNAWMKGVEKLGKAKRGDKTFIDGLAPAVDVLENDNYMAIQSAVKAAKEGAQNTIGMLAIHGRAAIRGEASRILLDPGAVVASLIVQALEITMKKEPLQSQSYLERPVWSSIRALYKGMGYSDYDLDRPMIGIANSWNQANPGHYNLRQVADYVKQGVYQAGGTPVEFGIIGPCDGMGCGNDGMRYILPSRDLIANEIESMVRINHFDAIVLLGSCDKVVPGLLMAAARLDIPAILVNGGPALGGMEFQGRASDNSSMVEALGMLDKGLVTEEAYIKLENCSNPCCGSCSFLGTANTMCAITEAMGMSLPGSSMIPAVMAERYRMAQLSGRRIVEMVGEGLTSRKIISKEGLTNALRLGMAIGGSTNMALHFPAIGYEADCEFNVDDIEQIAHTTPHIANIYPNGPQNVEEFYNAGGVLAVMKQLQPLLNSEAITCTGRKWNEILEEVLSVENEMIHSIENAFHQWGSLAVLRGNLAPDSAITKPTAIDETMLEFKGTAICFDSEEEASQAVMNGKICAGHVVVIRYEGPKGGPGMREMVRIMKLLNGRKLALSTALITDGRFSGSNNGCFVGHISPEASQGGPIAIVQDGDVIEIDIPNGRLSLLISDDEMKCRMEHLVIKKREVPRGYLNIYSRLAESADKGALIKNK